MNSLVHRLQAAAERTPEKVFVRWLSADGESPLSYAGLLAESERYAGYYHEQGLRQGDVLLLMLRPGPGNYPAFVGAMLAGIVPAFMPLPGPKQPPEVYWPAHREVVARKDIKAVLTQRDHAAEMAKQLPAAGLATLVVEELEQPSRTCGGYPAYSPAADDIAFIQHSSGTTGIKKGVCLPHGKVLSQIDAYAAQLGFDENARVASWLPLYHDMGLISSFLMPMAKGASIVASSPFDWMAAPHSWLEAAAAQACSHAWMPNFAFNYLAKTVQPHPGWNLSALRWINCSEPCQAGSFEQFKQRFAGAGVTDRAFQVCYAMAENVFAVTQTRSGQPPRRLSPKRGLSAGMEDLATESATEAPPETLSCGYAIPGVEIDIWNEARQPLSDGTVGEIVIRGDYLFSGYHDDPETTARRFHQGWFLTHDLGFMDAGELFVTGRVDDLINLYGKKIYAHTVEFAVGSMTGVIPGRCVAIGHASAETGSQELIVLAECMADADPVGLKRAIKLKVEAEIGVTAGKVELFGKGWLVKTTSGKISRYLNHKKYLETRDGAAPMPERQTLTT